MKGGEIAQLIDCISHEHEDLIWILRTPMKKLGMVAVQGVGNVDRPILGLAGCQPHLLGKFQARKRPCLKNRVVDA